MKNSTQSEKNLKLLLVVCTQQTMKDLMLNISSKCYHVIQVDQDNDTGVDCVDDPERGVELLEEVILLVVERGAAEMRDAERPSDGVPVRVGFLPGVLAAAA